MGGGGGGASAGKSRRETRSARTLTGRGGGDSGQREKREQRPGSGAAGQQRGAGPGALRGRHSRGKAGGERRRDFLAGCCSRGRRQWAAGGAGGTPRLRGGRGAGESAGSRDVRPAAPGGSRGAGRKWHDLPRGRRWRGKPASGRRHGLPRGRRSPGKAAGQAERVPEDSPEPEIGARGAGGSVATRPSSRGAS